MPALLIRHRVMRSRWTTAGLAVLAALALLALAAPWIAPGDPYHGRLAAALRRRRRRTRSGRTRKGGTC